MKRQRTATEEEIAKLRVRADSIRNLYTRNGMYPYEMYTLLATFAIDERIPFDMDTFLKV